MEILISISVYVLAYLFFRSSAKGMIEDIKTNFKFFPKHYIMPPRWMREHFALKKTEIPKFLFFRLLISLLHLILIPVQIIVYVILRFDPFVVYDFVLASCVYVIPDTIVFIIFSRVYKKR